ncbi:hypothetical protein [Streptomyces fuscigenes]|uniref:hypothetical protein n=1 Tax=Streptomyces fuscigenes TaxID=1528880 RepID=UPI001F316C2F|nr:hypothetical protein [Streptomyces fuscigenes]MCF3961619.1 hypothetical protein [Streptomyces fuscigenes]
MAETTDVVCACGCGESAPQEEMVELEGGQYVTPGCLEAVMMRGSLGEIGLGPPRPPDPPEEPRSDVA